LEDIKAPECFYVEERLKQEMGIPVFHDDQHGTAIIVAAGFLNALHLTGRDIRRTTLVCNGAGSAGIASLDLLVAMGMKRENIILCDSRGVVYKGRKAGMNRWKERYASDTNARTLADALQGADVVFGLSVKGAITQDMVRAMADKPVIFAMANPDPEITPEEVAQVRDDAIVATGRSDYPNQINNVLGFPYIFRGALDVRAARINDAMKIAAANALAQLARRDVPDSVAAAYQGHRPRYGPDYIIPAPFDPRLISFVAPAVAKAAIDSGVARSPIVNLEAYAARLKARLDPVAGLLERIYTAVQAHPKRTVFAEGEQPQVIRAAHEYLQRGLGQPLLVGRRAKIAEVSAQLGIALPEEMVILEPGTAERAEDYAAYLHNRLERRGFMYADCRQMVRNDPDIFAACVLALGEADAMVTGVSRGWSAAYKDVARAIDPYPGRCAIGVSVLMCRGRTVLVADSAVHAAPDAATLADVAQ
ncbi:MAG: NADP-dependent malic enzyme, partial [Alphaproteobacteria bacterium]